MPTAKGKVRPQIHMPEDLFLRLKEEADRRQVNVSDLVVTRLEQSYENEMEAAQKEQTILERRIEQLAYTQQQIYDCLVKVMGDVMVQQHTPAPTQKQPPQEVKIARYEDMYPELGRRA